MIAEIATASLSGRITGSLAGGSSADWLTMTRGSLGLPDVRMACRAHARVAPDPGPSGACPLL